MGMCLFGYFFQINFKSLKMPEIFGSSRPKSSFPYDSKYYFSHRENIWKKIWKESIQVLGCDDYDKVVLFLGHDDVG